MSYLSLVFKILFENFGMIAVTITNMIVFFYFFPPRFKWWLYPMLIAITYMALPAIYKVTILLFGTSVTSGLFMSLLGYLDILFVFICFRENLWKISFIAFTLCILNRLFTFIGYVFYMPLNLLAKGSIDIQVTTTLVIITMYLLIYFLGYFTLKDKGIHTIYTEFRTHNWIVLALMSISSKLIIDFCSDYVFYSRPHPNNKILWAMIALSIFVLAVLALYIYSTITSIKHFKLKISADIFTFEKEAQERYYETQLLNQNELHRMKHDMTGNLNTIFHLLSENNTKEALCYVAKLSDHYESRQRTLYSNDPYLNAVVTNYVAAFTRNAIMFEHDIEAGKVEMYHVEMCLILNNALQNALEASLKLPPENRYVKLQVKTKQNHLLFRITNRFNGEIIINNELPRSTKLEDGHGYGLTNIYDAAKSIGALVVYKVDENIFVLDVSINAKSL